MAAPPAWISEAEWLASAVKICTFIQAYQDENFHILAQLIALVTELVSRRERIGRSCRNTS